jgi:hypothetical protein
MAGIRIKGPSLAKAVRPIGRPSNVMHDHTVVMRAPRLNNLQTRDYGKKPVTTPDQGASFGQLGLTGET